ncbi:MAG: nucleoid-associated protein EbfC [Tepidanaerobacteraceae bacterium]|nr:nucleoid-associated protein EbfC [Tepidanaerobacteraceae bacterium]
MNGMGNMNKLMKQVQKMQQNMMKLQEELKDRTVEATSGGGVVKVTASGRKQLVNIEIKPEAVDPDDVEMLQDLILAAANEALQKAEDMVSQEMGKITGGLNIPGLF